jgi:PhoPQ-activated pathogenicity-related protein
MQRYFSKELGYTVIIASKDEKIYNPDCPVYWPDELRGLKYLKSIGNDAHFIHELKRVLCPTARIEVLPHYWGDGDTKTTLPKRRAKDTSSFFMTSKSKQSEIILNRLKANKKYQGPK